MSREGNRDTTQSCVRVDTERCAVRNFLGADARTERATRAEEPQDWKA